MTTIESKWCWINAMSLLKCICHAWKGGLCGRDHMVVGFTTTYDSVPIISNVVSSNLAHAGVLDTTLCDKVCQWLAAGRWFSPVTPVSSTNKTERHDIAEILLKVTLYTINQAKPMSKTENKNEGTMVCQFNVHHGSNKMSIAFLLRIYAEVYSMQLYVIKSVHQ